MTLAPQVVEAAEDWTRVAVGWCAFATLLMVVLEGRAIAERPLDLPIAYALTIGGLVLVQVAAGHLSPRRGLGRLERFYAFGFVVCTLIPYTSKPEALPACLPLAGLYIPGLVVSARVLQTPARRLLADAPRFRTLASCVIAAIVWIDFAVAGRPLPLVSLGVLLAAIVGFGALAGGRLPDWCPPRVAPARLNRDRARTAAQAIYHVSGLRPPAVVWARSPREAILFERLLETFLESPLDLADVGDTAWDDFVALSPTASLRDAADRLTPQIRRHLGSLVATARHGRLSATAVLDRLIAARALVPDRWWPADHALTGLAAFQIEEELGTAGVWRLDLTQRASRPARWWANEERPFEEPPASMRLGRASGGCRPLDGVVIVIEPAIERHGEAGYRRPHSARGPAVRWSDGFAAWALAGSPVPRAVVEKPASLDFEMIRKVERGGTRHMLIERFGSERYLEATAASALLVAAEPDREYARVLLARYGYERFVQEAGSVIAADLDSQGQPRRLWRADRAADDPVVVLEVTNSTPEPDGSRRTYWLRVPPEMTNCREAVAWTFGMLPEAYAPLVEA